MLRFGMLFTSLIAAAGCHGHGQDDGPDRRAIRVPSRRVEQVAPPMNVRATPEDAARTASGLRYKKLIANAGGAPITRADKVLIQYTGWRQRTGETFFSTTGRGQPIAIDLAHAAPGFAEALPLLRTGERAMIWLPASPGLPEPTAYEVEIVEVVKATPIRG
jgi:hypothetical protein